MSKQRRLCGLFCARCLGRNIRVAKTIHRTISIIRVRVCRDCGLRFDSVERPTYGDPQEKVPPKGHQCPPTVDPKPPPGDS